jgi:hypothetical protein
MPAAFDLDDDMCTDRFLAENMFDPFEMVLHVST